MLCVVLVIVVCVLLLCGCKCTILILCYHVASCMCCERYRSMLCLCVWFVSRRSAMQYSVSCAALFNLAIREC